MDRTATNAPDSLEWGVFSLVDEPAPHPDTSPESITRAQLAAVRIALRKVRRRGKSEAELVAAVSDATDLPVWNVRRKLAELGAIHASSAMTRLAKSPKMGDDHHAKVVAFLKASPRFERLAAIAAGTGLTRHEVRAVLVWTDGEFKKLSVSRGRGTEGRRVYQLRSFKPKGVTA